MDEETKQTILAHLAELRKRLIYCLIAVILTTGLAFVFTRDVFRLLESRARGISLIYIEMTEMLGAYFRVAVISGVVLALPFIVYQLVMFVRPGLTARERGYLYSLLFGLFISFALGAAFGYFILIPPMARFLITFGSDIATPAIRVGNFVSLMLRLIFAVGICFEMPILVFFLAKIGIVNAGLLARYRRFAIVGAFTLAAIITPTFDPINQTILALPLIVLYEVGILLARLARPAKRRAAG
ncbi:MAG: twin-arginine translocase subunit TatC [Chloroflexota bacterium]